MFIRRLFTLVAVLCILLVVDRPASAVEAGNALYNPFVIADQAANIVHPALAYNPQSQQYLAVWCQETQGSNTIYARLISKTGQLFPIYPVSSTTSGIDHCNPDVVYNPARQNYLIVWEDKDNIPAFIVRGRLFVPGVSTSDDITFPDNASSNFVHPAVAYSSTSDEFLVVWSYQPYGGSYSILAQRLSWSGTKLGGNYTVALGEAMILNYAPDVAYNPARNEYLVTWTRLDNGSAGGPNNDIFGRILTYDLVPLHGFLLIGYHTPQEGFSAVAAIPTPVPESGRYLVAWQITYSTGDHDIYARIVKGDGTMEDVITVSGSYLDEKYPAVAGNINSKNFLVSWTSTYGPAFPLNVGIRARNVALDETMTGANWAGGIVAGISAVAAGPQDDFLVALEDISLFANQDLFGRLWGDRIFLPLVKK
jgi:hypothetical protein